MAHTMKAQQSYHSLQDTKAQQKARVHEGNLRFCVCWHRTFTSEVESSSFVCRVPKYLREAISTKVTQEELFTSKPVLKNYNLNG